MAVAFALALVGTACEQRPLRPPVLDRSAIADPSAIWFDGRLHVFSTGTGSANIPHSMSRDDGRHIPWGDALPTPPSWARTPGREAGAFWAPTVAEIDGRFLLFFAAKHRSVPASRPGWCIGVAIARDPNDAFAPVDRPLFCSAPRSASSGRLSAVPVAGQGVIDPQIYQRGNRLWLHFKVLDHPWQLWGVELTADGRAPSGPARGLVRMAHDARVWERDPSAGHTILENPAMDFNRAGLRGAQYYLYYSGGSWRSDGYATGVAACRTPMGPCLRVTDTPWLRSRGAVKGPGGLSFATGGHGERLAYHHSWAIVDGQRRRVLHMEPFGYEGLAPVFLDRPPVNRVTLEPHPTRSDRLMIVGTGFDPDFRHRPMRYRISVDGHWRQSGQTYELNTWITLLEGTHTYCIELRDDFRGGLWSPVCRSVHTEPPPPPTTTTTTAPPPGDDTTTTTSSTSSTTTTPPSSTTLLPPIG